MWSTRSKLNPRASRRNRPKSSPDRPNPQPPGVPPCRPNRTRPVSANPRRRPVPERVCRGGTIMKQLAALITALALSPRRLAPPTGFRRSVGSMCRCMRPCRQDIGRLHAGTARLFGESFRLHHDRETSGEPQTRQHGGRLRRGDPRNQDAEPKGEGAVLLERFVGHFVHEGVLQGHADVSATGS